MLGFAETRQVRVNDRRDRTAVPKVDLDLAEVLALLQQVGGVGMTQSVDVGSFANAAGFEGDAKDALQSAAVHRLSGCGSAEATMTFAGKEKGGMPMAFPLLAQERQRAGG